MMFLAWIALIVVLYFITRAVVPAGGGCCGHCCHDHKQTDTPDSQA